MAETSNRVSRLSEKQLALLEKRRRGEFVPKKEAPKVVSRNRKGRFPLSFAQQRLWFLNQLEPGNTFYNISKVMRLEGELKLEALEQTVTEIVRRHEVLRTRFVTVDGEPWQEVAEVGEVKLAVTDLSGVDEEEREAAIQELVKAEGEVLFDLAHGPLLRVKVLRLSEQDHVVAMTIHHIVSDGWSMGVLLKEVATLYEAYSSGVESPLPELPLQYADFAVWQRERLGGEELERQLSYWRKQLGELPVLELPADRPRPAVINYRGAHLSVPVSLEIVTGLRELSRREGVTLFMTLLAGFQTLLHRYSGQEEIVVGTAIANRNRAEMEGLIGFFVNTLVLRADMSGEPTFVELLQRVKEVCLAAYAHQDVPFEKLVEELQPERDLSRSPLFQTMFILQNLSQEQSTSAGTNGLQLRGLRGETKTAKLDLIVSANEIPAGLELNVEYSTDLFDAARIVRMMQHFEVLLQGIVAQPQQRLWELPLLAAAEWEQTVKGWNETEQEFAVAANSLPELFAAQAARQPEAVAVVCGEEELSYGELNRRANQLAHYLQKLGVGPEQLVGLCVERSLELVVGMLGILKAGAAYLPLDPSYPAERLAFQIADSRSEVLLTTEQLAESVPGSAKVVKLDTEWAEIGAESDEELAGNTSAAELAYVIYTSGSTGRPKGVMVSHGSVLNLFAGINGRVGVGADEVWTNCHSAAFDFSVWELWGPLLSGGRLVIVPAATMQAPVEQRELIVAQGVTLLSLTPSGLLQVLSDGDEWLSQSSVKRLVVGGEACPAELAQQVSASGLPSWNFYGPTEATVWTSVGELKAGEPVTIGRPIYDTELYVLDRWQQPVAVGVRGEIYIGGVGLARGYWQRAELTAERFVPHPYRVGERLYRTGDEGRYLADGRIEYLGRGDQQVKVRGYRIELGEIEAALESHGGARQAVVTVGEAQQLVGYVVGESLAGSEREVGAELRAHLRERLPEYMVPQRWVVLEQMPLTANGKIDRRRLPAPSGAVAVEQEAGETTPVEELVGGIWSEVLKRESVGRNENFFELGGHSLLATQVISRVRQVLGVELPVRRLFEEPTVRGLSYGIEEQLRAGTGVTIPELRRLGATEREQWGSLLPLSFAQQRLWFINQLEPGNASYNVSKAIVLKGELHVEALERTLNEIVRRHDVLRTRFVEVGGEPRQEILPPVEMKLQVTDLSSLSDVAVIEAVSRETSEPFDLANGPLLRIKLLRLREQKHVAVLTMHHIVSDGWSIGVFIKEVAALYEAYSLGEESPFAELPVQYADFAVWQRGWLQGEELERQLTYWRKQLGGTLPVLELPTDRVRPALPSYRGARLGFSLSPEVSAGLKELSRREGVTLFMTLLTAFQTLLHRYSGQDDIVVGSPLAGRNYHDTERLIGFFINALALRTDLSGEPTFVELLKRVKEVCLGAYAHQDLPFEKLVEELQPERHLSHTPLFQTMLAFQNAPRQQMQLAGLELSQIGVANATAKFDLLLELQENGEQLLGAFEYSTDLFDEARIARVLRHFEVLLHGIVLNPEQRLWELPVLSEEEFAQTVSGWNDTRCDYEPGTVHELFEAQVERTPDAVALISSPGQLSYRELNQRANQLAHYLIKQGVGPDVAVGVCLERSLDFLVALLAILKAGGAYLPLDPDYPAERLRLMVEDSGLRVVLTQVKWLDRLPAAEGRQLLDITDDAAWAEEDQENPGVRVDTDQVAYIIFTSGSTGRPKGVLGLHRGTVNRFQWMWNVYPFAAGEVCCQKTSISFGDSVWETFGPLLQGIPAVIIGNDEVKDIDRFIDVLSRNGVTRVVLVPSLLRVILDARDVGTRLSKLKYCVCSGEALPLDLSKDFQQRLPECALLNLYGSSEASADATYHEVVKGEAETSVSIGRPLSNIQVYILDKRLQPLPVGARGELFVGGDALARGYVQGADLTADKFVPHPYSANGGERLYRTGDEARYLEDGRIEFLGRSDFQVKVRGFRIELGEIEAVLKSHSGVRQAVVTMREKQQLVAYVVAAEGESRFSSEREMAAELRGFLRERLPEYMVPQRWVALEQMPLTGSGKIDRQRLPAPSGAGAGEQEQEAASEWTPVEELVAGIWSEVLKVSAVGRDENFFELGGHSLLATQVISRVREMFGVELPLRRLFDEPTVRGLSNVIETELRAGAGVTVPVLQRLEEEARREMPLSFAQQRLWFLDQLQPESAFYNMGSALRLKGELHVEALEQALNEIVRRHEVLRTRFVNVSGEPRQEVLPAEEVKLVVTDLNDLAETEREAAVQRVAISENHAPFDLAQGPLLRVKLLRLGEQEHVMVLMMHHIVSDGWSMGVLTKELTSLYEAYSQGEASSLAELPVQYGDFAVWQRDWLQGEALERQLGYWRQQLHELPMLELPADRARPAMQSYRGAQLSFRLSPELSGGLRELSRREGATMFMTLLAGFQTLLYRYSGQEEIVVGTAIANRNLAQTEGLIGFFANTLVLRADLGGEPTFVELLQQVKEVCLGAYAHQDVPFEKLVEELQPERDLSRSPLFQTMFILQNQAQQTAIDIEGLQLSRLHGETKTAKLDLIVSATEFAGGLELNAEYSTDLFDAARIVRMMQHFEVLLQGIVAQPQQRLWELPLLAAAEWEQTVKGWNETQEEFAVAANSLPELFAAQAARQPEAVAVVCGEEELSYGELNRRANQLAHYLQKLGVGPEQLVGLCVERSLELVLGMLGILKAGAAYLPLDPSYPAERLAFQIADSHSEVLLTTEQLAESVPGSAKVVKLDTEWAEIGAESGEELAGNTSAAELAYVIYTSGSTGRPKGVMVSHGSVLNLFAGINGRVGVGADEVWTNCHSAAFDFSVWELWGPLLSGGRLVIVPAATMQAPVEQRELIVAQGVTLLSLTPSGLLQVLSDGDEWLERSGVRRLVIGGEACPAELAQQVSASGLPSWNFYGPTEATVWTSVGELKAGEPVTIGRPIYDTELYVLDRWQQPVAVGVRGEIYIGGVGLARGYWQRAELTAERFVPHPYQVGERLYRTGDEGRYLADGRIEYLGRGDQQVKVRGYRIELGEIEAALESHGGVRQAVVTVGEAQQLVGYVVGESLAGSEREVGAELRGHLRERLPEYMVPQRWVVLEQLPLTANGKIDRRRLPAPSGAVAVEQEAGETTPIEELVGGIWSEVLKRESVGRNENFFELGGHSLLATQVISRVRQVLGVELPVRRLFEEPTVRGLSYGIEEQLRAGSGVTIPSIQRLGAAERAQWNGLLPLSFAQQRLWFLHQLQPGASYNITKAVPLKGELHVDALERTFSEVVRRHEALRTRFVTVNDEPRQEVLTAQDLKLTIIDFTDLDVTEREAAALEVVRAQNDEPFDLAQAPLMRVKLLRLGDEVHALVLTMHHIVSDGWSMGVLIKEVTALYETYSLGSESVLPELPVQYGDFAVWQRSWLQGEELERQLTYWRKHLGGELPLLELPTDRVRPAVLSNLGARLNFQLTPEVSAALKELSRREGVTLFMTMLAAFQTLLHRYSGQQEIVVGTDVANRNYRETEGLIGFFVNQLVLRTDMGGEPTFLELLQRVKEMCLGAYAHQDVPFEKLVEELQPERDLSRSPLFEVVFLLNNESDPTRALPAAGDNEAPTDTLVRFDLTLSITDYQTTLAGSWYYRTSLFERTTIEKFRDNFAALLQSITANPNGRLSTFEILTASEKELSLMKKQARDEHKIQRLKALKRSV